MKGVADFCYYDLKKPRASGQAIEADGQSCHSKHYTFYMQMLKVELTLKTIFSKVNYLVSLSHMIV